MELDLQKYEAILKAQLADYVEKQKKNLEQIKGIPSEALGMSDPADQAQVMERQNFLNSQGAMLNSRIKKITHALQLIRDDEYGFCSSCGIDFTDKDLEEHPARTQCIECLSIIEKKNKHFS